MFIFYRLFTIIIVRYLYCIVFSPFWDKIVLNKLKVIHD